jgi:hypothetical protein
MESYGTRITKQIGNSHNHMGGLKLLATNFNPHYSKAGSYNLLPKKVGSVRFLKVIFVTVHCCTILDIYFISLSQFLIY